MRSRRALASLAGVVLMSLGTASDADAAAETGQAPRLPGRPQGRRRRRLPRRQGRRPLPLARRPRLARDPRLGRGREQGHVRLPRVDPRRGPDQGAAHQALGLREVRRPPQARGPATSTPGTAGSRIRRVLYTTDGLDGEPRVLLDPNTLSTDGTVALSGTSISDDGSLIAYGIAAAGSDWNEWKVRDVATGKDRDDHLKWIKFSGASWTKDGKGFFYSRFPEPEPGASLKGPNYYQKLYYHKLGTPQADDALVYERPDQKEWQFHGDVTEDGHYLIITVSQGDRRQEPHPLQGPRPSPTPKLVELIDNFEAEYSFIDNDGPVFWFKTNKDAPRGQGDRDRHPQARPDELGRADPRGGRDARRASRWSATTSSPRTSRTPTRRSSSSTSKGKFVREVEFPGLGHGRRASAASGRTGRRSTPSPPSPPRRPSIATTSPTGESTVFKRPKVDFNPDDYETTQVFYASKDGTKIPMFLSHKKGLKRDGHEPDLSLRLRRVQHRADARVQPGQHRLDGDGRRLRRSPTSGAAASTARTGTRPGPSSRSRTSSTTSSPRPSG